MTRKSKNKVRKLKDGPKEARKLKDVPKEDKRFWFTCEFCGIYKAYKPKCNKCEKEE